MKLSLMSVKQTGKVRTWMMYRHYWTLRSVGIRIGSAEKPGKGWARQQCQFNTLDCEVRIITEQ